MTADRSYEGQELELFAAARRWKSYWSQKIRPHLGRSVLEVGAGLGANTAFLHGPAQEDWLCLEPDALLAAQIPPRPPIRVIAGTLADLPPGEKFDTLLYIDVLEHIEDDHAELRRALSHLHPAGKIIVLSPAHPWLFTEFDRAIGHYRRYTRATLRACTPPGARLISLYALDSFGLLASLANKAFLHQSIPTPRQIAFWDRWLVTTSRWTDPLIGHAIGKSLVAIWQKPDGPA
jgi:SAM-dependent methyltransferase